MAGPTDREPLFAHLKLTKILHLKIIVAIKFITKEMSWLYYPYGTTMLALFGRYKFHSFSTLCKNLIMIF